MAIFPWLVFLSCCEPRHFSSSSYVLSQNQQAANQSPHVTTSRRVLERKNGSSRGGMRAMAMVSRALFKHNHWTLLTQPRAVANAGAMSKGGIFVETGLRLHSILLTYVLYPVRPKNRRRVSRRRLRRLLLIRKLPSLLCTLTFLALKFASFRTWSEIVKRGLPALNNKTCYQSRSCLE